ncbi:MAG TPA: aldolase/citrate lyase family protein [Planctomicrobium sp.]|nr:aldolase/citrate lyase family protein [Planctomicrobium sp.]
MTTSKHGAPFIGTWLSIGSPVIAELAGDFGFHWVLIDLEHGCATEAAVPDQLRALRGSRTIPIVRVGGVFPDQIGRLLDWGAGGIMVPHVETAEQAAVCVQAMRYPPHGHRGVSRSVRTYGYGRKPFPEAGSEAPSTSTPFLIVQIETLNAVEQVSAIAEVDGVDVLFVGPADLQFDLKSRPHRAEIDYEQCLQQVRLAAEKAGKNSGILVREPGDLEMLMSLGFRWIAMDSDIALLRAGYQRLSGLMQSLSPLEEGS